MIEIDGIRRTLEDPTTEAGDYISDEWARMLDLATSPSLTERSKNQLIASIARLNRNLGTTAVILTVYGEDELTHVYDSVADQVNGILLGTVEVRLEAIGDNLGSLPQYSGEFHWNL